MSFGILSQISAAPVCGSGSLATYIGTTCTEGNLLFSNFAYASSANPASKAVPATGIWVTPDFSPLDEGLQFSSGWETHGLGAFVDSLISFSVSTIDNSGSITDMELSFNGNHLWGGQTGVTETYCVSGPLVGCVNGGQLQVNNPPPTLNDHVTFAGASQVYVSKDIILTANGYYDKAWISSVTDKFSQSSVPEPATLGLIGAALIAFGVKLRSR